MTSFQAGFLIGAVAGIVLASVYIFIWSLAAAAGRADDYAERLRRGIEAADAPDFIPDDWIA